MAGVAIPTLVSRTVAAVVIVCLLFNEKLELHRESETQQARLSELEALTEQSRMPVSYTHLDVYKRQASHPFTKGYSQMGQSMIGWAQK